VSGDVFSGIADVDGDAADADGEAVGGVVAADVSDGDGGAEGDGDAEGDGETEGEVVTEGDDGAEGDEVAGAPLPQPVNSAVTIKIANRTANAFFIFSHLIIIRVKKPSPKPPDIHDPAGTHQRSGQSNDFGERLVHHSRE